MSAQKKGNDMSKILGRLTCQCCHGMRDSFGHDPEGKPVTFNLELFDVIGIDEHGLFILNCPKQHHTSPWFFISAQEYLNVDGYRDMVGSLPL